MYPDASFAMDNALIDRLTGDDPGRSLPTLSRTVRTRP